MDGTFRPIAVLNDILEQHRLEAPHLRLIREGKPVPAERVEAGLTERDQRLPRRTNPLLQR
jgi:hypothetical protein